MATKWGDREARRSDILRVSRELLRENGLAALQMREVARSAGIALGTVYTYFPTKESLYAAMYAERLDRMLTELEPALETQTDPEELFVIVATSYRDVYAEYGKDLDILSVLEGRPELDPAVRAQLAASTIQVFAGLRKVIDGVAVGQPDLAMTVLWSTITGLANHFTSIRHELHTYTWDETVRFAARGLVRGFITERQTQ
ncbi:TetR/AcrR family transcriptional regulator [Antrihabitans sp. YC3-6]|uniref:TetR/AcrR family transcriptional regulator n=1 Tax=Antrihabitans stalagmiti TaxID=2799499 RepID=A0A934U2U5_9NOCA|nr:TetR/AcrR family transcriptional regulator [Antrihabitans stalagmiti]MBJ8339047.1 TetR/AcrR family transcriptional regulator [Antrihabitans stalagmiti]